MHARYYADPADPGRKIQTESEWISDAAYAEMIRKMPIPCTDIVVTLADDREAIYLAKRVAYPMPGVLCLGGRISFNDETLEDSAVRCLFLETGLKITADRLEAVGPMQCYSWIKVAQGDFGGKNLALTFRLNISKEELEKMEAGLQPKEYNTTFGIQRFTRERLMSENVHPAMLDLFNDIFSS